MNQRLNLWFGKKPSALPEAIDPNRVPRHVAIIMDGNGRWAKERGLPRIAGHHSGMKNVKKITIAASNLGVQVLTLYAFSTENWKRPKEEVEFLMNLPKEFFPLEIGELIRRNVQVRMTGCPDHLPDYALKPIEDAIRKTEHNTGMILNFAVNYGGRRELVLSMRQIARKVQAGELLPEQINEQEISRFLQTDDLPDPDLLIRTSGELRISNFMLWQLAYSELWFTDVYWPTFSEEHLMEAVREYQHRVRRYGGV